ncbi:unnamed protein product [Schistosoma margrebowiei]|uniref:Uncharacterized protein n=1 Tax=Schistosoma margrebowiei TaxID=48269 RepID=A0A183LRL6_9TREM|nr:unnamed protein product [Schistosoma margrebowiei]
MKTSTSEGKHGIQPIDWMQLDNLYFVDDLALLSHAQQQIQVMTTSVASCSVPIGLNIYKGKCKIFKHTQRAPIQSHMMEKLWKGVECFT